MPPTVFLDRDGVLIKDKHYLHDPEQVELLPGVAAGLRLLAAAGYALVVISNQSGVGRGYFTRADVDAVHVRLRQLLAAEGVTLEHFYYCPHAPPGLVTDDGTPKPSCSCRKPAPGLVNQAVRDLGLRLEGSCMIGDKRSDVALGRAVGIATVLMTTGHGAAELQRPGPAPDYVAHDLEEAARWLLDRPKATGGEAS